MPDVYLVIDLIVVVALLVLGLTVLLKNSSVELNRIFALFVAFISIWIIANYVSNDIQNAPRTAVIANYFVFFFSYSAAVYLLRFAVILAGDVKAQKHMQRLTIPFVLIGISAATPLVVKGVALQGQVYAVLFGVIAPLYFVTLVATVGAVLFILRRNIKRTVGDQHGRLVVLFRSLLLTMPVLLVMQAIIPATTGWFGLTNIGILPMLILVYGLYYGVVKHRLFDLRFIIVRSLAYVITLGVISVFYGFTTHYLAGLIARADNAFVGDLLNVVLIIVVVIFYAPLKSLFDKLTNKFFYQDAYDPQDLFDQLNRALVSSLDVRFLMETSAGIIGQHLKSEFCVISIKDDGKGYRLFGVEKTALDRHDMAEIRHLTAHHKEGVILADYLDQETDAALKIALQKANIAALVRLTPNAAEDPDQGSIGFIVLGTKRTGGAYTRLDARVLDALANELVIAVQNALRYEETTKFNIRLTQEVENATRRLRATNEKLRQMDQTKDDFISMASHQLRTPLTSVKGYVSMVLDGDAGKLTTMQRKLLNQSYISAQRMVYLISDLLNVSRLRTGKFIIEAIPSNLSKVIKDEIDQLKETAKGRNLELTYNQPEHFPTLMLDETKIRQVIMNFIDNAIYYTPSGGRIQVNLVDKRDTIEFTVVDNGIGVSKHEQPHLFTKFYRANNAKHARPDGTGLGLFMAKKVIIAQGGAVIFKSQEGKGSTFGFTFAKKPLLPPAGPPPAPPV